jgi:hypothetical protein
MRKFLPILVAALALSGAARADCYDVFGCTNKDAFRAQDLASGPNCDFLYTMRNAIYAEHHYCFKTARAIATFGNALGLNRMELANAATILRVEHAKGCPE